MGDRVKTDRRDALKLAKALWSGDLTAVSAPDPAQEALRDLTRAREAANGDLLRIRHRISKMLLRLGIEPPQEIKRRWTREYEQWIAGITFEAVEQKVVWACHLEVMEQAKERLRRLTAALTEAAGGSKHAALIAGLQCLRGVGLVSAVTWVAELGDVAGRFLTARSLMGYAGLGVKEWSSGGKERRGGITKTGNGHVRFIAVEAAWHYRHRPGVSGSLQQRRKGQPETVIAIADKTQERLHRRFWHLLRKGKADTCAVTAVARELLGFVWAVACEVNALKEPPQPVTVKG
jgi:transposase